MDNNDIIRRLRYIFDFSDSEMIEIFGHAELKVTREEVSDWLKQDDAESFRNLQDKTLAQFLNGFITFQRGKQDGPIPKPEDRLNNNLILRKLKIALSLKTDDVLDVFKLAGMPISPHELSAFLRNPKQSQYRLCKDQYLRNFLHGLQKHFREKE